MIFRVIRTKKPPLFIGHIVKYLARVNGLDILLAELKQAEIGEGVSIPIFLDCGNILYCEKTTEAAIKMDAYSLYSFHREGDQSQYDKLLK